MNLTSKQVRVARKVLGITQAELAEQVFANRVTIAEIERYPDEIPETSVTRAITALLQSQPNIILQDGVMYLAIR